MDDSLDEKLISGEFLFDADIPVEKKFLLRYFKNNLQRRFLLYFIHFEQMYKVSPFRFYNNFVDHTGFFCKPRMVRRYIQWLKELVEIRDKAKANLDLKLLEEVEKGKLKVFIS